MPLHLIQAILTLAFSGPALILFIVWWFMRPNKNNRKDLLAATIGVALLLTLEHIYYIVGPDNRKDVDGVLVQFERPIWVGIRAIPLMIGVGLFLAADYHAILLYMFFAVSATAAWEAGALGGSLANMAPDGYWFCWGLVAMFLCLCGKAFFMQRNKDKKGWLIILLGVCFSAFYGASWLLGPMFTQTFGNNTEAWIVLPGDILTAVLCILMNVLQGEEDSIWNKNVRPVLNNMHITKHTTSQA